MKILTDVNGQDTKKAKADLEAAELPSLFSYRQAYFVGCQAQLDQDKADAEVEKREIFAEIETKMLHPVQVKGFIWLALKSKCLKE